MVHIRPLFERLVTLSGNQRSLTSGASLMVRRGSYVMMWVDSRGDLIADLARFGMRVFLFFDCVPLCYCIYFRRSKGGRAPPFERELTTAGGSGFPFSSAVNDLRLKAQKINKCACKHRCGSARRSIDVVLGSTIRIERCLETPDDVTAVKTINSLHWESRQQVRCSTKPGVFRPPSG